MSIINQLILSKMKKVILSISALAIVALAAFNLNLTYNRESKVNVVLSGFMSLAENENGGGGCDYILYQITWGDCNQQFSYSCIDGDRIYCFSGDSYYNCFFHVFDNVLTIPCH